MSRFLTSPGIRRSKKIFTRVCRQLLELAKIQEARETPSVKILDSAIVPERKSFPPRFEIIVFGNIVLGRLRVLPGYWAQEQWQRRIPGIPARCWYEGSCFEFRECGVIATVAPA